MAFDHNPHDRSDASGPGNGAREARLEDGWLERATDRARLRATARDLAKRIQETHRPSLPDGHPQESWRTCVSCNQGYVGAYEVQPMWPCDARRLANAVLGNDGDDPVYVVPAVPDNPRDYEAATDWIAPDAEVEEFIENLDKQNRT